MNIVFGEFKGMRGEDDQEWGYYNEESYSRMILIEEGKAPVTALLIDLANTHKGLDLMEGLDVSKSQYRAYLMNSETNAILVICHISAISLGQEVVNGTVEVAEMILDF